MSFRTDTKERIRAALDAVPLAPTGAAGVEGRRALGMVELVGACGASHVMSFADARELADWLSDGAAQRDRELARRAADFQRAMRRLVGDGE